MKTFNLACAGIAVCAVIVSAILWRELRTQRELMVEWQRAHPAGAALNPLQLPGAPPAAMEESAAQPVAANAGSAARHETPSIAEQIARDQEQLKDPVYRDYALSRIRQMAPRNYPGLVEALGLSASEASVLYDVLAAQQLETSSQLLVSSGAATSDPASAREMARERQDMQRRHEASLASILGSTRYQKWQEYQETRRVRQQVEAAYGPAMRAVGQPLSEAQVKALGAVLVAERKRQQEEMQSMRGIAPASRPVNMEQVREEYAQRQRESSERIIAASRPSLTTQQLESLRAALYQQMPAPTGSIRQN
jgi:hypothetical protein